MPFILGICLILHARFNQRYRTVNRRAYNADENLRLALVHLVQVLGEAARRVSQETQAGYTTIPWREIIGMRHKIVHDYLDVDEDIVWIVVTQNIPAVLRQLEVIAA